MLTAVLLAAIGSADLWRSWARGRGAGAITAAGRGSGADAGAGADVGTGAGAGAGGWVGSVRSAWARAVSGAAAPGSSARHRLPAGIGLVVAIAVSWLVIVVLAATGLGVPLRMIALCLLAAGAWLWLTTSAEHETGRAGRAAVVGLIVFVALLFFFDRTALGASGYLVDGHRAAASSLLREAPLAAIATVVGVALFLCESANIVVRIALRAPNRAAAAPAATPAIDAPATTPGATADAPAIATPGTGTATPDASHAATPDATTTLDTSTPSDATATATPSDPTITDAAGVDLTRVDLKGGRLIGPLERLLIVALVLAGFPPIVAALVAAKGIVRFPEIADDVRNGDGLSGTKAEYFLVGSLVSWAVAGAAVALIVVSAHN